MFQLHDQSVFSLDDPEYLNTQGFLGASYSSYEKRLLATSDSNSCPSLCTEHHTRDKAYFREISQIWLETDKTDRHFTLYYE